MSNVTPLQPRTPKRHRSSKENGSPAPARTVRPPLASPIPSHPPLLPTNHTLPYTTPQRVFQPQKARKMYRNGYESKPKTPSYTPYKLNNPGHPRQKAFAFSDFERLSSLADISLECWNELAVSEGVLKEGQCLWDYQVEAANVIISRARDMCVIAPTGSGKSHLWILPLLAQKKGISIVIIPYTSLGFQGEQRHSQSSIKCTFLYSGSHGKHILEEIARGGEKHVIYTCVEMLETPAVAQVIHSESFQAQLSGIYIDEAHVPHESHSWRPSYARLHVLRTIIGTDAPLICISATMPKLYRDSLQKFAGLRPDYHLINLGNFRPELSMIIAPMKHPASSFLDLTFVLPWNSTPESIPQTIIYCDNLEMLTAMFWWFHTRLGSMSLPVDLLDILHAGLSEKHQKLCTDDFISGKTKILLGSDKIGAGMDFPHVTLVVQYRCRGLTLVRWEQRRGRGGRRKGMSALGVILVEKSMTGEEDDKLSAQSPKSEDPGLLDLIQTPGCQEAVVDVRLENPPRASTQTRCGRCSNCNPNLRLSSNLSWIMEDPQPRKSGVRGITSAQQKNTMLAKFKSWRLEVWKEDWKDKWPSYGAEDLISDADLHEVVRRIQTIKTVDDLDAVTHIPHLDDLGDTLLQTLTKIRLEVLGDWIDDDISQTLVNPPSNTDPASMFENLQWTEPECPATIENSIAIEDERGEIGLLARGEFILSF